ncbi:MAG TPA: hypothetical protein VIH54_09080 [Chthoniobacterales bacterium]|jgi:hypothetical protein
MSAIIQLFAPAELLFQPSARKENAAAKEEAEFVGPSAVCEPEPKFWKRPSEAVAANNPAFDMLVLALFLLMAIVSIANCFAELSHLIQSDAIGRVAMNAVSGGR